MENEGDFSERVNKTFGALFKSLEPSRISNPPPWSLTGGVVEKREWRRDKDFTSSRDSNPCSSSFDHFISHTRKNSNKNLGDCSDGFGNGNGNADDGGDVDADGGGGCGGGVDDLDVRSSIGLDSTLDFEEEEDTYDKVAIGRENAGDRYYMKDITGNQKSHFGSQDDLSNTFECKKKDPRANHSAARIRLREDAVEAATQAEVYKVGQASKSGKNSSAPAEDNDKVKPILKRKEQGSSSRQSKRVRFDPGCINNDGGVGRAETVKEAPSAHDESLLEEKVSRVPDYVRNPSKYKCYSLDSRGDLSDNSNTGAFLDLAEIAKRSNNGGSGSEQVEAHVDLPKSISFILKKKSDTAKETGVQRMSSKDGEGSKSSSLQSTSFMGIASEEDQETEVGDMEIDESGVSTGHDKGTSFRKQCRQYRLKSTIE